MKTHRDNAATTSGGLSIATVPASARTNQPVNYTIAGRAYLKASTDNLFALAGAALAANQLCAFFLLLDAAGTATVSQSAVKAAATNPSGYVAGAFEWPEESPTKVCIGAVIVRSGASAFTPGTTSLAGAGVATYVNVIDDLGVAIGY